MLIATTVPASDDATAPALHIDGKPVSESNCHRSALLHDIAQLEGPTELSISKDAYSLWEDFPATVPASPTELAALISVASFLKDPESADEAARHLAAGIRSALRSSLRRSGASTLTHLPAFDPPAATSLAGSSSIAALTFLLPPDAEIVFRLLHPLELCHLPEPHRSAALDTYATRTPPAMDLSAPQLTRTCPAPARWEDACQHALSTLRGRPISALRVSHIGRMTASYLRDIGPHLSALSMRSTHAAPMLTFLEHAKTLTRLDIAFEHAPRASLLDSLLGLPNLRQLSLRLGTMSGDDQRRAESLARVAHSTMDDAGAPGALAQPHRLWGVTHATLVDTRPIHSPAFSSCRWPAQLACLLNFHSLETLTCFPPYFATGHPIFSRAPTPLAALMLTNPDRGAGAGGDFLEDMMAAAGGGGWPQLTRLALEPMTSAGELLPLLPGLRDLSLAQVGPEHVPALARVLPGLSALQALSFFLRPVPAAAPPALSDTGVPPRCDELCNVLCTVRTLPLTRLVLSGSPPHPQTLSEVAALTHLRHLEWASMLHEGWGQVDDAAACMLRSCTLLTALKLHLQSLPRHPGRTSAALSALPQLHRLELHVADSALQTTAEHSTQQADAVPPPLPSLRHLALHFDSKTDAAEQLSWLARWDVAALTHLSVDVPSMCVRAQAETHGSSPPVAVLFDGDAPLLGRVPRLQELVLPADTLRSAADACAAGPLLRRLTRLERLVVFHGCWDVAEALLPFVRDLPLGRGVL